MLQFMSQDILPFRNGVSISEQLHRLQSVWEKSRNSFQVWVGVERAAKAPAAAALWPAADWHEIMTLMAEVWRISSLHCKSIYENCPICKFMFPQTTDTHITKKYLHSGLRKTADSCRELQINANLHIEGGYQAYRVMPQRRLLKRQNTCCRIKGRGCLKVRIECAISNPLNKSFFSLFVWRKS